MGRFNYWYGYHIKLSNHD